MDGWNGEIGNAVRHVRFVKTWRIRLGLLLPSTIIQSLYLHCTLKAN